MRYLLILCGLSVLSANTCTTCYIDYVGGADTNDGTAKSTGGGHGPWQHAPGMFVCTSNCAAQTPVHGDSYIFKGGVTWPNASLGWNWIWSGNATTHSPGCAGTGCIYLGIDQTWFTGGSWSRPILNGQGSAVATPSGGVANCILRLYGNYTIVDNIEFTGLFWSGSPAYGTGVNIALGAGSPGIGTNDEIMNTYIHGWSHATHAGGTSENPCGILGDTGIPNNNVNTIAHNNAIDGSDTDQASCSAFFGAPPYIQSNFVQYVTSSAVVNGTVLVDGNTFVNIEPSFDTSAHENGLEINASQAVQVSNNLIAHLGPGVLAFWCAPYPTFTCTVFNNLIYDTDTGNVFDVAPAVWTTGNCTKGAGVYCTASGTTKAYNNTVECGPDSNPNAVCVAGIDSTATAVILENNHWITNATSPNGGMWSSSGPTPTTNTNLLQSKATASGQGYTSAEAYPFSPISPGSGSTVGAATNLTGSLCGTFAALCSDFTAGVFYNATTHVVTSGNRTATARPSTGASWDIGAYQYIPPNFTAVTPGLTFAGPAIVAK